MRLRLLLVAATGLLLVCAAGEAQEGGNGAEAFQLSVPVQETLARLREQWLVWNSAFLQGDREQASSATQELLLTARELGMSRLPELAIGILVRSVEAAREGDTERSRWGLEMAEQLDPGRAESAFARARIAYVDGSYIECVGAYVVGYLRVFRDVLQRLVWMHNLVLWVLAVLLVTAAMFVAVQMAVKGSLLYRNLAEFLTHHLPSFAAYVFAVVILVWPFVLPSGWVWGVLYWASLLMAYGTRSERLVLGGVCGLFAVAPVVALEQQRGLEIALSEPMRALEMLADGALYGAVFRDLGTLRTTLPESKAVGHLIADVHTLLGQDQLARPVYVSVLEGESENAGALVNLGNFHYHRREYIKAIEHYRRAVEADPERLEAHYNLSQAYRSLLEFGDADTYLEQARRLDADQVNEWIAERVIVVPTREGLARRDEIRSELRAAWPETGGPAGLLSEARSAPVALGALVLGIVLSFVRRPGHGRARTERGQSRVDHWVHALVPGLSSAEEGAGLRALLAQLVPIAALLLPIAGGLAYRIPWGYDPGNAFLWIAAITVLISYFLVRLRLVFG